MSDVGSTRVKTTIDKKNKEKDEQTVETICALKLYIFIYVDCRKYVKVDSSYNT